MDDGSNDRGSLRLHTESFNLAEKNLLLAALNTKWGIEGEVIKQGRYSIIRFYKSSMPKIRSIISPFLLPYFTYKVV